MTTPRHLEELLRKYYDGSTSPEEEVSLYISLLEEPEDSPYRPDLIAMEHMMMAAAQLSLAEQKEQATQEVRYKSVGALSRNIFGLPLLPWLSLSLSAPLSGNPPPSPTALGVTLAP